MPFTESVRGEPTAGCQITLRGDVLVIEIPLAFLRGELRSIPRTKRRGNGAWALGMERSERAQKAARDAKNTLQSAVPPRQDAGPPLTPRERHVLDLILAGLQNKEIGARLHICERAVKFHVTSILTKLKMSSRTDIFLAYARRHPLERLDAELDSH